MKSSVPGRISVLSRGTRLPLPPASRSVTQPWPSTPRWKSGKFSKVGFHPPNPVLFRGNNSACACVTSGESAARGELRRLREGVHYGWRSDRPRSSSYDLRYSHCIVLYILPGSQIADRRALGGACPWRGDSHGAGTFPVCQVASCRDLAGYRRLGIHNHVCGYRPRCGRTGDPGCGGIRHPAIGRRNRVLPGCGDDSSRPESLLKTAPGNLSRGEVPATPCPSSKPRFLSTEVSPRVAVRISSCSGRLLRQAPFRSPMHTVAVKHPLLPPKRWQGVPIPCVRICRHASRNPSSCGPPAA